MYGLFSKISTYVMRFKKSWLRVKSKLFRGAKNVEKMKKLIFWRSNFDK